MRLVGVLFLLGFGTAYATYYLYTQAQNINSTSSDTKNYPVNRKPIWDVTPSSPPSGKPSSAGVLNGRATNLVQPQYPRSAGTVGAAGAVNIKVTVDEKGGVISAQAVSGHLRLRTSAEIAARQSRFQPMLLSEKPVAYSGVVIYSFQP